MTIQYVYRRFAIASFQNTQVHAPMSVMNIMFSFQGATIESICNNRNEYCGITLWYPLEVGHYVMGVREIQYLL